MLDFLPQNVTDSLRNINLNKVYEIRLRAEKPVMINYEGVYCYLGAYGLTDCAPKALFCERGVAIFVVVQLPRGERRGWTSVAQSIPYHSPLGEKN